MDQSWDVSLTGGKISVSFLEELMGKQRITNMVSEGTVLEGLRKKVFEDRYALRDEKQQLLEYYPEQMWRRVAKAIASVEESEEKRERWEEEFYKILEDFTFVPGGRILSAGGTGTDVTYMNCFVIPSPEDSRKGIIENLGEMIEAMSRGGGVGLNISTLRPRGSHVKTVNGTSSGPVPWAEMYSTATGKVISQGGSRRGALLLLLEDDHPDIFEFITAKEINPLTKKPDNLEYANVSVGISDAFMRAVKEDLPWNLKWGHKGEEKVLYRTVRAREIWDLIAEKAWASAEPGLIFLERYNKMNPLKESEDILACNPCFVGSTRVATSLGLLRADELASLNIPLSVTVDKRAGYEYLYPSSGKTERDIPLGTMSHLSSPMIKTGLDQEIVSLKTKHGYTLKVTKNHKLLTPFGYKEVAELQEGDTLYLQTGEGQWSQNRDLPPIHYTNESYKRLSNRIEKGIASPPTQWSKELGQILGWATGDGWIFSDKGNLSFSLMFGPTKMSLYPFYASLISQWFGVEGNTIDRNGCITKVYSSGVAQFFLSLGLYASKSPEKRIPSSIWSAPRDVVIGYLQGLFSTDGTVSVSSAKKSCSIRLASSSPLLLEDVQILLTNFGIVTHLHLRRDAQYRMMPDSKRELKEYWTAAQYELILDKENRDKFLSTIGFLLPEKQNKAQSFISSKLRPSNKEWFTTTISSLTSAGREDVYDLTEPITHSIIINGIVSHQCGEQGLPAWGVCNLGSINLSNFVGDDKKIDYVHLYRTAKTAIRFLDNVIDITPYWDERNRKAQLEGARRTGLGTMGLADMLIKMGVRYGSEESLPIIESVFRLIRDASYESSAELSQEKEPFPWYNQEVYKEGIFYQDLPEIVKDQIQQNGLRNGVILTSAPTGTTSLLSGVSSGIEPIFAFETERVDRLGTHLMVHPLLEEWRKKHPDQEDPSYFVSSSDLSPKEHILVQAAIQKYTDSSISKTANVPFDFTPQDIQDLYMYAYDLGCKGVTCYRQGSRDAVLTDVSHKKDPPKVETLSVEGSDIKITLKEGERTYSGIALKAGDQGNGEYISQEVLQDMADEFNSQETPLLVHYQREDPFDAFVKVHYKDGVIEEMPGTLGDVKIVPTIKKRPSRLKGYTHSMKAPEGTVHITINSDEEGPAEVFTAVGRAGSDIAALSEALGRLISLVLRVPSLMSQEQRLAEVSAQLRGIGGSSSVGMGPKRVLSVPDAVAQVLALHIEERKDLDASSLTKVEAPEKEGRQGGILGYQSGREALGGTLLKDVPSLETAVLHTDPFFYPGTDVSVSLPSKRRQTGNICPDCGGASLIYEEGCSKCFQCGYSRC